MYYFAIDMDSQSNFFRPSVSSDRGSGRRPSHRLGPRGACYLYCRWDLGRFSPPQKHKFLAAFRRFPLSMDRSRLEEEDAANRMPKFHLVRILWLVENRVFGTQEDYLLLPVLPSVFENRFWLSSGYLYPSVTLLGASYNIFRLSIDTFHWNFYFFGAKYLGIFSLNALYEQLATPCFQCCWLL